MKTTETTPVAGEPANGRESPLDRFCPWMQDPVLRQLQPKGMPLLCGEEDLEMGETTIHTTTVDILFYGLLFHFALQAAYRVFSDLNLYFTDEPTEYVSPDVMVVKSRHPLPAQLTSYRIGPRTPAPLFVAEVLSRRTWNQSDLQAKPGTYAALGVDEYLVADVTGEMLPQRLLLLRPRRDGSWQAEQDADGGVTSRLGFRVVLEPDGQLRVLDAQTGKRYARPDEAQRAADELAADIEARRRAEERVRALEAEIARLRGNGPKAKPQAKKGRRRKS
jgi:Uma2 family endonuclease